jgi:hypothetical protein
MLSPCAATRRDQPETATQDAGGATSSQNRKADKNDDEKALTASRGRHVGTLQCRIAQRGITKRQKSEIQKCKKLSVFGDKAAIRYRPFLK